MNVHWRRCVALLVPIALALLPAAVRADVQRFAVVVGNDDGASGELPLRYAESDAARVYEVLRELGGFLPVDMVLLKGEDARTVEDTIIAMNERVRAALAEPGAQAMLFVYYSGHADGAALHLGRSGLPTKRLSQLVAGSAATFRLMVLDACRSGSVTRRKGGHIVAASPLITEEALPGSGLAVLAASAAHEDAQESEEIGGSFFTHAFVSGLMGAADQDGDGAVALGEAYQYAYDATLRATSRTLFGTQHPTFRFDFGGQGSIVLTRPALFAAARAVLQFPAGAGFLVLRNDAGGSVVGEVGEYDRRRSLSVKPGRYFVRGRGRDVLFEGRFELASGSTTLVDTAAMERVEYARLVRKGGRASGVAHGVELGPWLRSVLPNADTPCVGAFAAYALELQHLGLRTRAGACTSHFSNQRVDAVTNEYDLELRVARAADFSFVSLELSLGAGAALFTQRFETQGSASARNSVSPYLLLGAGVRAELGAGYALGLDAAGETHFLRLASSSRGSAEFAARASLLLGKSF